jgi:hypothetical protein
MNSCSRYLTKAIFDQQRHQAQNALRWKIAAERCLCRNDAPPQFATAIGGAAEAR